MQFKYLNSLSRRKITPRDSDHFAIHPMYFNRGDLQLNICPFVLQCSSGWFSIRERTFVNSRRAVFLSFLFGLLSLCPSPSSKLDSTKNYAWTLTGAARNISTLEKNVPTLDESLRKLMVRASHSPEKLWMPKVSCRLESSLLGSGNAFTLPSAIAPSVRSPPGSRHRLAAIVAVLWTCSRIIH